MAEPVPIVKVKAHRASEGSYSPPGQSCAAIRTLVAAACVGLACTPAAAQIVQPFTPDDLVKLLRVSDPQISPNGRQLAYVVRETDMEANQGRTDIWLLDLTMENGKPRRLTDHAADDNSPRWSPDGQQLYFLSTRSGSSQVWRLQMTVGNVTQVTDYPLDVGALKVAPLGHRIAFSMHVDANCAQLTCTKELLERKERSPATGRLHERLFVRHWDTWKDGTRAHLFTATLDGDGKAGTPIDVSGELDADVPSKPSGGDEDFAFSPDGQGLVFSARVGGRGEPWSTNFDLYWVSVDGSFAPRNLTESNPAWDAQPVFLPNGDLTWIATERAGYEADRFRIMLRTASGDVRILTPSWDRTVSRLGVMPDGRQLFATTDDLGQRALYGIDLVSRKPKKIVGTGYVAEFVPMRDSIVFSWASLGAPADLYLVNANGGHPRRLTAVNEELLASRTLGEFEQFRFLGAGGDAVHGYIVRPHGFDATRKYPLAFFVPGGPQVSFQNQWHYRWNAQAFAGAGYAFVTIDYHGATGYGQAFTDSINRDWGGKPLEDLQRGLEYVLQRYSWIDAGRICALGASYGGFMVNWIAGHWQEPFRCFVNHAGPFDMRSFYYSTEELWFPEWDFGGPYFEQPRVYEQFNPVLAVEKWSKPMLVTHGMLDFRVPYTQGLSTFTALQRRGIESRLLIFPDESHLVLKPSNSRQQYEVMLEWLDRHTGMVK